MTTYLGPCLLAAVAAGVQCWSLNRGRVPTDSANKFACILSQKPSAPKKWLNPQFITPDLTFSVRRRHAHSTLPRSLAPCRQVDALYAGEVGYLAASIKTVADARVGDTITLKKAPAAQALPHVAPQPRKSAHAFLQSAARPPACQKPAAA